MYALYILRADLPPYLFYGRALSFAFNVGIFAFANGYRLEVPAKDSFFLKASVLFRPIANGLVFYTSAELFTSVLLAVRWREADLFFA